MKTLLSAGLVALALTSLSVGEAMANPQHERMKRCNAEAKEQALKGDERKAFMSTCLKGRHGPAAEDAESAAAPAAKAALGDEAAVERSGAPLAATGEAVDEKARTQACNQAATEQSLKGAKRKAFVSECMKG